MSFRNSYGFTLFAQACSSNHSEIVKCIIMTQGRLEIVKYLMNNEIIDVNKEDNYGFTPFAQACSSNQSEIIKCMVNNKRIDFNKANIGE